MAGSQISDTGNTQIEASMLNNMIVTTNNATRYVLPAMRFGSYTWPHNPVKCSYVCERIVAKFKYPEMSGITVDDLGADGIIIAGQGEFFGPTAYQDWQKLNAAFKAGGVKSFYHPVYGDVTKAIFKKLASDLEPLENYVSYSFEIWEVTPSVDLLAGGGVVVVPTFPWNDDPPSSTGKKYGTLKRGNRSGWVMDLQKLLKKGGFSLTIDGIYGPQTESVVRKYQAKHKLTVDGVAGPHTLKAIGLAYYTDSPARPLSTSSGGSSGGYKWYTVKAEYESPKCLAAEWHVSLSSLRSLNGWKSANDHKILKKGTRVKIPKKGYRGTEYYTIAGSVRTLFAVATVTGVYIETLGRLNQSLASPTTWGVQLPIGTDIRTN